MATTLATPARTSVLERRWFPVAVFLAVSAALAIVVWQTAVHLPRLPHLGPPNPDIPGGELFEGWIRWDAGWYIGIVGDGYSYVPGSQSSVAFFPAYPLLVLAVATLIGGTITDSIAAGMLVTWTCGLTVAVLFWRWCRARMATSAAATALVILLVFPYAWFLHLSIYADALFIAAVLASFLLLDSDHPWLAGLAGAVATAARPVGVAVVIGLGVRALERRGALRVPDHLRLRLPAGLRLRLPTGIHLDRVRRADAGILLSLGGVGGYAAYLWARFGDPMAFAAVQAAPGWEQESGLRTWLKIAFVGQLVNGEDGFVTLRLVAQAVLTVAALALVPLVVRRFGWGYGAFALAVVALPAISTKDFQGMGRYLLAAFPCFALVGELLDSRPRLRLPVVGISALLLMFLTSLSARGYYLT